MSDRPAVETKEIEVTPEMIEAGVGEVAGYDDRFETIEEVVERVYRAMRRVFEKSTTSLWRSWIRWRAFLQGSINIL